MKKLITVPILWLLVFTGSAHADTTPYQHNAVRFLNQHADLVAKLAHPLLIPDKAHAFISKHPDKVVLDIKYEPSSVLELRYETQITYTVTHQGIVSASVNYDTALIPAFNSLEVLRSMVLDVLDDDALKEMVRTSTSGVQLHMVYLWTLGG